jgi:hypothetical protein
VQPSVYVARDEPTFWTWVDGGRAVAWTQGPGTPGAGGEPGDRALAAPGPTIAFTAELGQLLRLVAGDGLPSFPALLLVLAACRDGWQEAAEASFSRIVAASAEDADAPDRLLPAIAAANGALHVISALPPELRTGLEARAALVAELFAGTPPRVAARDAAEVVAALEEGVAPPSVAGSLRAIDRLGERSEPEVDRAPGGRTESGSIAREARSADRARRSIAERHAGGGPGGGPIEALVEELAIVTACLARAGIAGEALERGARLRRATGLARLPGPAPIPAAPVTGGLVVAELEPDEPAEAERADAERIRGLVDALEGDVELGGVARLARALRAAVHVPRPVEREDELPLGGVSDIANRGPLDRLLVSELAHDELTFAVRVATGEALYLRREAPPRAPAGGRALLVDVGVRLWGSARSLAAAVALALGATAGKGRVRTWRAQNAGLVEVDLRGRGGLEKLLGRLETSPHPGPLLRPFLAAADAGDGPARRGDLVLVTHEDALADKELDLALAALRPDLERGGRARGLYVATVDGEGCYRLRLVTARGRRLLQEARLDLQALLAPRGPARPDRRRPNEPALGWRPPLALGLPVFPLRLPHGVDPLRAVHHPRHGVAALTRDGRLMHWPRAGLGGLQRVDDVPLRPLQLLDLDAAGEVVLAVGPHERVLTVLRVDLGTGAVTRVVVPCHRTPLAVVRRGGSLLLIHDGLVETASLVTGRHTDPAALPAGVSWRHGRFFRDRTRWYAAGVDTGRLTLDPLPESDAAPAPGHVWDREAVYGVEGPWCLSHAGNAYPIHGAGPSTTVPVHGADDALVGAWNSRDGHRLLVRTARAWTLVDLVSGERRTVRDASRDPATRVALLEPEVVRTQAGAPQVRSRLLGLAIDDQGRLALVSRKKRVHALVASPLDDLELVAAQGARLRCWRAFDGVVPAPGTGPPWRAATWPDGSRALLDGRGVLHLQPRTGVEVTLALAEGPLAAWTSDGLLVGPRFFTGEVGSIVTGGAVRVLAHVAAFCEAIR